jgi:hypothetical protein
LTGLEYYLIFALATALAGLYELVVPVIWVLKSTHAELIVVKNRFTTYTISTILMFIAAPIFFPLVIVPKFGVAFRFSLHKTMLGNQE